MRTCEYFLSDAKDAVVEQGRYYTSAIGVRMSCADMSSVPKASRQSRRCTRTRVLSLRTSAQSFQNGDDIRVWIFLDLQAKLAPSSTRWPKRFRV
jgi:hypothetical protein